MSGLDFRVLGPVEVISAGGPLVIGRGKALDVLATLLASPNQVISLDALAETVWHARPPVDPRAALHGVVARLRRLIGGGYIETLPSGYRFGAEADFLDLLRFERLVASADQAQPGGDALGLLTEAIGLWRGTPFGNVSLPALLNGVVPRLSQLYLGACEQWAGLSLQAGRHDAVVARLAVLVAEHPFRERMAGQLMLGLYRSGRQADAIDVYESLRRALSDEMGIDPGPELQGLHLKILRADPSLADRPAPAGDAAPGLPVPGDGPGGGVPHRLPADTRAFTGRHAELARLLELAGRTGDGQGPGTVVISAIDGMAGIGKTALAVHAAHLLAGRFGDGQLFINLHGYTEGYPPRTTDQALETFLRTLGVPPQQVPADTEERAALYRERLAGTRTLIVLDNAADEAQVRPLIPGEAGCLVLVTSRRKLKALDDADTMALDVLPAPAATALFAAVAGPGRVQAADPVVAEIAELCGRLPLTVRIAAALLRNRPAWTPGDLAGTLRAARARLEAFADGDRDLAALFDLSSQALDDGQRRLYRHLGHTPGPDADIYAAAALLDTDPAAAKRLLQQLVDHNLLHESPAGRYRMHDLIRAHARAQALPAPERQAATGRLLDYYQHTAGRADARITRYAMLMPAGSAPAHAPALPDAGTARAWLRAERANLTACLHHAIRRGQDDHTVALAAGLAGQFRTDGPWPQAAAIHAAAAAAAARLGDRPRRARALTELGKMQRLSDDYPAASGSLQDALELHSEAGDKPGQADCLVELASIQRLSSDKEGADRTLQAALELYQQASDEPGQARAMTELGIVRYMSADYRGAGRILQAALELCQQVSDRSGEARALTNLAQIQQLTGSPGEATRNAEAALAICQELGDRLGQANALSTLGTLRRLAGDYDDAARYQQVAMDVNRDLGDRLGQAIAQTALAEVHGLAGDYESAARDLEAATGTFRDLGSPSNQAWALNHHAAVIAAAGDPGRAAAVYGEALDLARQVQQPDDEATALCGLSDLYLRRGEIQDGAACLRQALEIYQRLGTPEAEQVAARLAEIGAPQPGHECGVRGGDGGYKLARDGGPGGS